MSRRIIRFLTFNNVRNYFYVIWCILMCFLFYLDVSGEVVSTSTISSSGSTASSSASAKGGSSSNDATSMMIPTLLVLTMMGGSALSLVL